MVDRGTFVATQREPSTAAQTWFQFVGVAEHLAGGVEAVCARYGITKQQYKVLYFLRDVHPGGAARCEMSKRCVRSSPDMTRMIDRLVRRRLVTRTRSAEDGRVSVATITSSGLALLERMEPEIVAAVRRAVAPLDRDQLRALARLCDALVP